MQVANHPGTRANGNRLAANESTDGQNAQIDVLPKTDLKTAVEKALPVLNDLHAIAEVYGLAKNARKLLRVIHQLESALPAQAEPHNLMAFLVNTRFTVERFRVAELLRRAYQSGDWFRVVAQRAPQEFQFRADPEEVVEELDFPLNQGGSIEFAVDQKTPARFRLDLESIASGLDVLARNYPRHFADFLNSSEDEITASVFLQCCLFGEIIYE